MRISGRLPSRLTRRLLGPLRLGVPGLLIAAVAIGWQSTPAAAPRDVKPAFASKLVSSATKGHAVLVDVDVSGAKQLFLVVTDGGDSFSCDWADWAEPRLVGEKGETKLTDLKWKSASADWGQVRVNKNAGGGALKINGKEVEYGIGTHANSMIVFDLPAGTKRFKALAGLDNGGTDQGGGSTVEFFVFTEPPPRQFLAKRSGGGGGGNDSEQRDPENAVAGLDVYEGLEATLFASEPTLTNPTNIDVDARGRVWVCDVANYRGHNGERPEGDRILILEDTDGDGKSDKTTVFYQGKDMISPMGICVLGNKVIVSASPNVWVFTDENGDDKPDKKEVLFSNTGNFQHDHSVHSFVFGPDGKLYFNMGNAGSRVCDKDGKVIVDKAGNKVENDGHPYRQGMVFRCNMDGSEFEVLAHNFRNNYEMCVDSFGNIWQSDNDDDGNKAVRINYVMEGGNYGYTDEMTGAGWQSPRTNMETEIPRRHWHQNDPGVVPNVLITGAGAPSGICVYEGDLLPKPFHGNVLHCEPGQNSVRCYRMEQDGAGFKCAETIEILKGARDNWFRPADVCVAPDGSLFVSDWYDPGVGGHAQGDTGRGRIFRVAPKGKKYKVETLGANASDEIVAALKSPCLATRFVAWKQFGEIGDADKNRVYNALEKLEMEAHASDAAAFCARLIGFSSLHNAPRGLFNLFPRGTWDVLGAFDHPDVRVKVAGWRILELVGASVPDWSDDDLRNVGEHDLDSEPLEVRRELAITLRRTTNNATARLWMELASFHDGKDRWYLEALGIGAANKWDACLDAWLEKVGDNWNTPAGRDIIWRSRAKKTPGLLAKIILDEKIPTAELPRYLRAFDFQAKGPQLDAALVQIAFAGFADAERRKLVSTEALKRLGRGFDVTKDPAAQAALGQLLDEIRGTSQFVDLVSRFHIQTRYGELLALAQQQPDGQLAVEAMQALLETSEGPELIEKSLVSGDVAAATSTAIALGGAANKQATDMLMRALVDVSRHLEIRKAAARSLAKTKRGAEDILAMVKSMMIPREVAAGAAFTLHAAPWPEIRAEAGKLFPPPPSKNDAPLPPIAELVKRRGDATRGKAIFAAAGTCAKCHKVGDEGKEVGPALSEIGDKLSLAAVYESILFPSAGIAHSYETYTLRLEDGSVVTGLLVSKTPEEIVIKGEDALNRTFKADEVDEMKKQPISIMPADLQKLMTVDELVDVAEYLTTLRKAKGAVGGGQ
ncbi:MAG: PVC-type heme-binding CxxCH protein [Pirellulales bacterium]